MIARDIKETVQINLRLPEELVQLIDKAVENNYFTNRQELIKSAIRAYLKTGSSSKEQHQEMEAKQ